MKQLRGPVLFVIVAGLISVLGVYLGSQVAWAAAKGTLRVAVVGFDRESTALWEGSPLCCPIAAICMTRSSRLMTMGS